MRESTEAAIFDGAFVALGRGTYSLWPVADVAVCRDTQLVMWGMREAVTDAVDPAQEHLTWVASGSSISRVFGAVVMP